MGEAGSGVEAGFVLLMGRVLGSVWSAEIKLLGVVQMH